MNIDFINKEHKEYFNTYMEKAGCSFKDIERTALLYILASNDKYRRQVETFYNFDTGLIQSDSLEKVILSGGERSILRLAFHLFTGSDIYNATLCNTFESLDCNNVLVALNAVKIKFDIDRNILKGGNYYV